MRTILILASAAFASAAVSGSAAADDRLHLTPPLYREQARDIRQIHPMDELTTTPQPVSAPVTRRSTVSAIDHRMVQASAETRR
ncbi:hypothetical protein [Methylobacterium sp. J-070]|uniref:hypothetical protein n=1 Tax=Methylobacterium sp. J-070 TaxID=2836650 RepID=UPI001FBB47E0|nr:hypothetical protein [Methylobacterium sp. J-070]MCJ2052552.1 hypothetical protein [Methylobacterium sp. J-070]